jgi:hypothetical protein
MGNASLYKYCDQLGIIKILGALELKLPNISQVNDPLECLPFFYCPDDKSAIEARYLSALKHKNMIPSADYKQELNEQFEKDEIRKKLAENSRKLQGDWNRKSCLLSVSKTARNTVMWAHYADKHKGVVIGIDFDNIFPNKGIQMHRVDYSEQRPKINILTDFESSPKAFLKKLLTKSVDWSYEKEFRTIFLVDYLEDLQRQGLACLKDFNGKETWFLRLQPLSIKEVIFGLYTEECLKLAIRKLIERAELKHVKLYQAEESETYVFNLIDIGSIRAV